MAAEVVMPKLGLLMTEGVIVRWLKANGQPVVQGEPIVTIMTKKITYQVVAPAAGIVHHTARVEQTLRIGERLALIAALGEELPDLELVPEGGPVGHGIEGGAKGNGQAAFVLASPWARRLARELGIDLAQVRGTGDGGCVLGRDVERAAAQANGGARAAVRTNGNRTAYPSPGQTIPLSGIRRMIAGRMVESLRSMAQATINIEADVTRLVELLRQDRRPDVPLEVIDVLIKAVSACLVDHPRLNATVLGDELQLLDEVHIGYAVAQAEGVLVPVIREADRLRLADIARERQRLLAAARAGTLTVDEVTGSTFTISDLGPYGVDFYVPIINPPEVALLGVGRILEKPAVQRGEVCVRARIVLSLAFDQRVVDGAPAGAFLRDVAGLIEDPESILRPESEEAGRPAGAGCVPGPDLDGGAR